MRLANKMMIIRKRRTMDNFCRERAETYCVFWQAGQSSFRLPLQLKLILIVSFQVHLYWHSVHIGIYFFILPYIEKESPRLNV